MTRTVIYSFVSLNTIITKIEHSNGHFSAIEPNSGIDAVTPFRHNFHSRKVVPDTTLNERWFDT